MTAAHRFGAIEIAIMFGVLLGAGGAAANDVRTKDKAGFSEIAVPQITGSIPLHRAPEAGDPKQLKTGQSQPIPNQPVRCGPENAQSAACSEASKAR